MITVGQLFTLLQNSDRIRIVQNKETVTVGFLANLVERDQYQEYKDKPVKRFQSAAELKHRDWERLGLIRPMEPAETADFRFEELELKIYEEIHI